LAEGNPHAMHSNFFVIRDGFYNVETEANTSHLIVT